MTPSIAVVIPTRNRADLAIAAIRSLLALGHPGIRHIVVSNNSSEQEHVRELEAFAQASADPRLLLVRPARSLPMAEHWDWAAREALRVTDATHVALHYDRRITKETFPLVLDIAGRWPEHAVTYLLDLVLPDPPRFVPYRVQWTGGLYRIRTSRALELAARARLTDLWQSFPVLVNSVVPRTIFERVLDRFGSVCASTSPESCFGFRFSAIEDEYLHFDRPLGVHYAFGRSNGMGYLRGETSGTFGDFVKLHDERPWLDAAPIPGLSLGQNTFYHEYSVARRDAGSAKFPAIDKTAYLADLARGLAWITDPAKRAEAEAVLASHGWLAPEPHRPPPPWLRVVRRLRRMLAGHPPPAPETASPTFCDSESQALHLAMTATAPTPESTVLAPLMPQPVDWPAVPESVR